MKLEKLYKAEFLNEKQIRNLQEDRLRAHLNYCAKNSPFYRRLFQEKNSNVGKINLSTLPALPFTTKEDLQKFNKDFLAVSPSSIADIVSSSGTTGRPVHIMYTAYDLERLGYNEEKAFTGCGMTNNDTVLLTCTMDRCFVAGLAYFLGARALGCAVIRNGLNSVESHAEMVTNLKPTTIVGVPSFIRKLGSYLREKGIGRTTVDKIICIGEPLRNEYLDLLKVAKDIAQLWNARIYSTYSTTEIVTTFCECTQKSGGHLHPDLGVVEIVDDKGKLLPSGEKGEVVVTPLAVEGMPLVRFKTGDISFLIEGHCGCGRNSTRLGPILGRKQQMIKFKGTTLYPQAVFSAVEEVKGLGEYYVEVTSENALSDNIKICVSGANLAKEDVENILRSRLRVTPDISIEDEKIIKEKIFNPASRKPVRFFDRRGR
jgi:phenylacetate-CoA ligase